MKIDVNEELKIIENALRDIITFALRIKYGDNWIDFLKINENIKDKWQNKMDEELKRFKGAKIETRLIYYSEFHDLHNIIEKHWDDVFKEVFKDKKQIDALLDVIEDYRISIAHNRELMEFQKNFLVGASGMIRTLITEYRADRDDLNSYYPKFENILVNGSNILELGELSKFLKKVYHVGDEVEVSVNVSCPPDVKVKYAIEITNKGLFHFKDVEYEEVNSKKFKFTENDISSSYIYVAVKSNKEYHLLRDKDLYKSFRINILP